MTDEEACLTFYTDYARAYNVSVMSMADGRRLRWWSSIEPTFDQWQNT